jgi:Uma2 family endonuclease
VDGFKRPHISGSSYTKGEGLFMATTPKALTYAEWIQLPEAEGIEEVVNGEIRKMPPNRWDHARIVEALAAALRAQVDPHKVYVVTTVFGLVVNRDPVTMRVPDLAVFRADQIVEQDGYIHSAPELVVEILSPANTRLEREEKLKDYESLGVPEVWVVSPEARSVEVHVLKDGRLSITALLKEGSISPARFPGVFVEIRQIWPG